MNVPQPSESAVVSQYPLPPEKYYQQFDEDNADFAPAPPRPPAHGDTYSMFGVTYTTEERLPSLRESGREVLYDETLRRTDELKRLNSELLNVFVNLLDSVCESEAPEKLREKVTQIESILVNMHHLVNTFRQDQARIEIFDLIYRQTVLREQATKRLREGARGALKLIDTAKTTLESSESLTNVDEELRRLKISLANSASHGKKPGPNTAAVPNATREIVTEMERMCGL